MAIPENNCVDIDSWCFPSPDMGRYGQVINLYVEDNPQTDTERLVYNTLVAQLPPPQQHGVRIRVWKTFYPNTPYPGLTVGMKDVTVVSSNEILIAYDDFVMANVPWDKLGGKC